MTSQREFTDFLRLVWPPWTRHMKRNVSNPAPPSETLEADQSVASAVCRNRHVPPEPISVAPTAKNGNPSRIFGVA